MVILSTKKARLTSPASGFGVGATYALSKRTKVYTYYTAIKSDGAAAARLYAGNVQDFSSFAVGIRHNF